MIDALGHYKILSQLGTGGMGDVFRARDTVLGRTVVVKLLSGNVAADPEYRERFLQEARVASALSHPSIATLFEIGEGGPHLYVVFEYVPGQPLTRLISGRPVNVRSALHVAVQLADALAEAHTKDIVHRRISPDNIMVTPKGQAKFLDFGLVEWTQGGAGTTQADQAIPLGIVAYLSPEQTIEEPVDHRTDLFSLGVILFEMLTGRLPFADRATGATVARMAQEVPPAPSSVNRDVPRELDAVVRRALAGKPDDRYQSAAALAAECRSHCRHTGRRAGASSPDSDTPIGRAAVVGAPGHRGRACLVHWRRVVDLAGGGSSTLATLVRAAYFTGDCRGATRCGRYRPRLFRQWPQRRSHQSSWPNSRADRRRTLVDA